MTQAHLDRWLTDGPANRREARPFITWAVDRGLAHHVDIPRPQPGRPTVFAGQQQAADLPAPILADLLGLHIATAVRWTKYAQRDWNAYIAGRCEDGT